MINLEKNYHGVRVFITGDTGFKGAWLAFWLAELGAEVCGYALSPLSYQRLFLDLQLSKRIRHIDGDIRDFSLLHQTIHVFKPTIVFHLAAQSLVQTSYQHPRDTFDVNVQGSVNLLEAVRGCDSVRSLIYVTSDKCYKNKEWIWSYRENDELGGHDPYSASKAAAELVFSSYCDSFFKLTNMGVASVRAGNVIGGGDWSCNRIIPDAIKSLQAQESIKLRNPSSVRPWQHVLEPLSGYLLLAIHLLLDPKQYSGSWNFGPQVGSVKTVSELAEVIVENWGSGKVEYASNPEMAHEAGLLALNCDKAHQQLGWKAKWDFRDAVKKTIEWYKLVDKVSPIELTRQQILEYIMDYNSTKNCGEKND